MEPLDAMSAATATFLAVLDGVGPGQLSMATPCEDWDVQALLTHVIVGDEMAVALLEGASQDEARTYLDQEVGDDIVDRCRTTLAAQLAQIRAIDDWDAVVHHVIGEIPASQLLRFRIGDLTLHAWDLANAIGVEDGIPDDLADVVYVGLAPMAPFIAETGMFGSGPSGTVPEDAPLRTRLLDLTGRRP
jgi:uncharacterized protein (TIGR03086 family)